VYGHVQELGLSYFEGSGDTAAGDTAYRLTAEADQMGAMVFAFLQVGRNFARYDTRVQVPVSCTDPVKVPRTSNKRCSPKTNGSFCESECWNEVRVSGAIGYSFLL
jgi:hypothetical protein